jgi:Group II intron, maturase-specific domain
MTTGEVAIFLGYTFRDRRSKNRWGKYFVNFSPGVSNAATKAIRQEIRAWQLHCRVDKRIDDLARMFNPIIRGWMNYYGRYYKSALRPMSRAMGDVEIQTSAATSKTGRALGTGHCLSRPHAGGPLADAAQDSGWTVRAG